MGTLQRQKCDPPTVLIFVVCFGAAAILVAARLVLSI